LGREGVRFLVLALFFILFSPIVDALPLADDSSPPVTIKSEVVEGELAQKIDRYLTRITPFGFSGALLVGMEEKIILNKGYGMAIRSKGIPNTSRTVFNTGSITKQFTAAGIMKLWIQAALKTEEPITKFFKDVPEEKREITLHHLLTHTAGVIDAVGDDYVVAERDETARKILKAPLLFRPGERFEYSNAGYSLLAAVIEIVSGKSYEEFLNEHLFKPAGMEFTGYRIPEWDKRVVAHWYVGDKDNGNPLEKPYPYWNVIGNGEILSTTEDMYRWHLALLADEVLSPEAKKRIFTPYLNDYGYGWDVFKTERGILIQHDGGSGLGSRAEIRRYINAGVVTILFCNQSYGQRALMEVVRDHIENLVFGGEVETPPAVVSLNEEALKTFDGTYRLSSGSQFKVKGRRGQLIISPEDQEAVTLLFSSGQADPNHFMELNKLSVSVFEAALKGDFKPFEDILHNKEKRALLVRQLIEERVDMFKKRTGEIKEVKAKAAVPVFLDGEEAVLTCVQLEGEKSSLFFGLYWRDRTNIGVAPLRSVPDLSVPFMPLSGNEFAGYRLDIAKKTNVRFEVDETGKVLGLALRSPGGERIARKLETKVKSPFPST